MPYKDKEAARVYHTEWQRAWRAAHPEKAPIYRAAADPMKAAYNTHKGGAKKRNIPFLLTFDQWLAIWQASGKWEQRGVKKSQYVMARFGDTGPYDVGNVRICTQTENHLEAHIGRRCSIETRERMSASQQGKKHSAESRKRMSEAHQGRGSITDKQRAALALRWMRHTSGAPPPSSLTGDDPVQTDHQQAPQSASE